MSWTRPTIFISYSRTDSTFVDQLETDLQRNGFHTWIDRRGLEGGLDWVDQLQGAIDKCQILLVVLSPDAVQSEYVLMEYRYAKSQGKLVIPLEYRPTSRVPMDLHTIQRIIFSNNYSQGFQDLFQALNRFSGPIPAPPPVSPPNSTHTNLSACTNPIRRFTSARTTSSAAIFEARATQIYPPRLGIFWRFGYRSRRYYLHYCP
jgi:hypothetical protein